MFAEISPVLYSRQLAQAPDSAARRDADARRGGPPRARPYNVLSAPRTPPDEAAMNDHRPTADLLESVHAFPGTYQMKVIGATGGDFTARVLAVAAEELAAASDVDHTLRETPDGRHVAITLDLTVQTAEQVRAIYGRIKELDGLKLLL
jgi:putative lipoic acid-binding regulatory protein